MRRARVALVAALALLLALVAAPATATAATPETVVGYYNTNYGTELFRFGLNAGTCNQAGYTWTLNSQQMGNVSSLWFSASSSRCNWLSVMNFNGHWWGTCIHWGRSGYSFGPDFNDRTLKVHISRRVECGAF
jgi:hypothetical protein